MRSHLARSLHLLLSLILITTGMGFDLPSTTQPAVGVQTVPAGFADTLVANPGGQVTAFAFAPDGRLLITTQGGTLRVVENGSLLSTPALNFNTGWPVRRICSDFERGLLGIAVDPNFAANNYLYLYYTAVVTPTLVTDCASGAGRNSPNVVNRVSRFTLTGNTVLTTTEQVLVDNIPSLNGNHNGGDLNFGKDGYLYVSAGDAGTGGSLARQKSNLAGKILRVNSDGTAPTSNPFYNDPGARRCGTPGPQGSPGSSSCQEIFAYGLRNPYRFAFDPNTSGNTVRFFINDVGQNTWEEIDEGQAGADYGWNIREGPCPNGQNCTPSLPSAYTDPIHWYSHSIGNVITGGAFMPNGLGWPGAYNSAYFFADGGAETIFWMTWNGSSYTRNTFGTNLGYVVHLRFGPYNATQALYYSTGGQVRRIAYTPIPVAVPSANPAYGATPLDVTFSAQGSYGGNGNPLTYSWNFGDGSSVVNTSSLTVNHTYNQTNIYTATLTASDGSQTSAPATVQVQPGNTPPTPTITAPAPGSTFIVGQTINVQGSATDAQAQAVTLRWEVLLWHVDSANPGNAHTHTLVTLNGGSGQFTAPAPEDFNATDLSYVEVRLSATDAWGLTGVVSRTLQPELVTVTFATQPAGLQVQVNERVLTDGDAVTSWEAATLTATTWGQISGTERWAFDHWADGNLPNNPRTIVTPGSNTTYTAVFVPAQTIFLPIIRRFVQ